MAKDWRAGARDLLVVLLTVTTGGVDAAAFLHLGHVFSSVITGTLVLLGIAAGTHDGVLAENCAVALASYVAGVAVGAPLSARRTGRWLARWRGRRSHAVIARREIWPSWLTVALGLFVVFVFDVAIGGLRTLLGVPLLRGMGAAEGADVGDQAPEHLHRGSARRIRQGFRLSHVPRQCGL